jgi:hypothetical protein
MAKVGWIAKHPPPTLSPAVVTIACMRLLSSSARSFRSVYSLHAFRAVYTRRSPFLQYQPKYNHTNAYHDPNDDMAKDKGEGKGGGYVLKVPKGTKDWDGKDMVIREKIFKTITEVFKRHGGVTIDTLVNDPASIGVVHQANSSQQTCV